MTVSAGVLRAPVLSSSWSFLLVFRLHFIFTDFWSLISVPDLQSLNRSSSSFWADLNPFSDLPEWEARVLMGP